MSGALVLIVTTAIDIIEIEANANSLAGIHGKLCFEMIFTIVLVTAFLKGDVCDRGEGVDEMELIYFGDEEIVRLCEIKLLWFLPIGKNAVQAWRAQIAQRVVFAIFSFSKDRVHVHVLKGIGFRSGAVTKTFVHRPGEKSPWCFFV